MDNLNRLTHPQYNILFSCCYKFLSNFIIIRVRKRPFKPDIDFYIYMYYYYYYFFFT